MKKILLALALLVGLFFALPAKGEAATNLPIHTISGIAFQDIIQNGRYDIEGIELGLKNQTVALYTSLENAKTNQQAIAIKKTSLIGGYAFIGLKAGTYFVKYYDEASKFLPVSHTENGGITVVNVTDDSLNFTANLPLNRVTDIFVTPFSDHNMNGLKEENEAVKDGKTMIIIDLKLFAQAIQKDMLKSINVASLVAGGLTSGNVDLAEGIYLRTTANHEAIKLPQAQAGAYVMVRSPFNLTLQDTLSNAERIVAIATILVNGNLDSVLANPTLMMTGDIDTNNDNVAIKKLSTVFGQLAVEASKIDYDLALKNQVINIGDVTSGQFQSISNLLSALPAFRVGVVTYFGNIYDITGLRLVQTNDFLFGIKDFATLTGSVFLDLDNNGSKGSLEIAGATSTVTAYDEAGNILATDTSTTLSPTYTLSCLPYNQPIYLGITTDSPVAPLLETSTLPAILSDKKIVSKVVIEKTQAETEVTQNIAVMASVPTSVTANLLSFDASKATAKLAFKNTDRLSVATVYYSLNGGAEQPLTLSKAPLLGSAKAVEKTLAGTRPAGQNVVKIYWKKGIYKINLDDIKF
jgi:hypothetical protein